MPSVDVDKNGGVSTEQGEPSLPTGSTVAIGEKPRKRLKMSLSQSKQISPAIAPIRDMTNCSSSRFANPVSSLEREKAAQGVIPSNTENTQWAVCTFNVWAVNGSFLDAGEPIPDDLLASHDPQLVCKWLCRFVIKTRKSDGSPYSPSSLRSLVCSLNSVLQKNKHPFCCRQE